MAVKFFSIHRWLTVILLQILFRGLPCEQSVGFSPEPGDVVAVRNRELRMACQPTGILPIKTEWLKNGVPLVSDARRSILRDGTLYFRRVVHRPSRNRSDAGRYHCVVSDKYGKIASRILTLTVVSGAPRIAAQPISQSAQRGEVVSFTCKTRQAIGITVTWEKDRHSLPQNDKYTLNNGVLQINNVDTSDAAKYRCKVTSISGQRYSREAQLNVTTDNSQIPLRLLVGPKDEARTKGDRVLLQCAVTGVPKAEVTWAREDGKSIAGIRFSRIHGNLRITNVQLSDAAVYVCTAASSTSQPSSQPITAKARLTVHSLPEIKDAPRNENRPVVSTVRFTCSAHGVPQPTISWYKDGLPVDPSKVKFDAITNKSSVVIVMSKTRDSGYYQCRAENAAGYTQATGRLVIKTSQDAPDPPSSLRASPVSSTQVRLEWTPAPPSRLPILAYTVHSFPTEKRSEELQRVVDEDKTSVIISQLRPFTNYTFYVRAYNSRSASVESSEHVTALTMQDVPLDVPALRVAAVSASSIRVSWPRMTVVRARGIITNYKLMYRQRGAASQMVENISGSLLSYTITGLRAGTRYEVRMLAGTAVGYTKPVEEKWPWVEGYTLGGLNKTEGHALAVQLRALNTTAILVTWHPITLHSKVDQVTGFKVTYRKVSADQSDAPATATLSLPRSARQHVIARLDPLSWYEISVAAVTENGEGQLTMRTTKTQASPNSSADALSPLPPVVIEPVPLNESAIRVRWNRPQTEDPIVRYSMRYNALSSEQADWPDANILTSEDTELVVTGLQPYTTYVFAVRSHSTNQTGPYSGEVRCSTREGKPSAPEDVIVKLVSPRSVELTWTPPAHKNGVIVSYVIHYAGKQASMSAVSWDVKTEKGTVTKTLVANLSENTVYRFKVQAATKAGLGLETKVYQIQTQHNPLLHQETPPTAADTQSWQPLSAQKQLGIILGISVSVVCIIVCVAVLLLRNRCCRPVTLPVDAGDSPIYTGNGKVKYANGHVTSGYGRVVRMNGNGHLGGLGLSNQELETFTPMLGGLAAGSPDHLDTKGGNGCIMSGRGVRSESGHDESGTVAPGQQMPDPLDVFLDTSRADEGYDEEQSNPLPPHPDAAHDSSQLPLLGTAHTGQEDSDRGTGSYHTLESLPDPAHETDHQGAACAMSLSSQDTVRSPGAATDSASLTSAASSIGHQEAGHHDDQASYSNNNNELCPSTSAPPTAGRHPTHTPTNDNQHPHNTAALTRERHQTHTPTNDNRSTQHSEAHNNNPPPSSSSSSSASSSVRTSLPHHTAAPSQSRSQGHNSSSTFTQTIPPPNCIPSPLETGRDAELHRSSQAPEAAYSKAALVCQV